jgi:integrase/recombinase XerD
MKISQAVERYVSWKKSLGLRYTSVEKFLASFSRGMKDRPVSEITRAQVSAFLNRTKCSNSTWLQNYDKLSRFFRYLEILGELKQWPMPVARPKQPSTFIPYIYSRSEIKRLLRATIQWDTGRRRRISSKTFRTLLLFLYGTGTLVSEALNLTKNNLDFRRKIVRVKRHSDSATRSIPIGPDVQELLRLYLRSSSELKQECAYVFATVDGKRIAPATLVGNFRRLRYLARIVSHKGRSSQPRMHDLRNTFAVHRVAAWYRQGMDAQRMVPALAAYLGLVGLRSTEKYLSLTPEHFRAQVVRHRN